MSAPKTGKSEPLVKDGLGEALRDEFVDDFSPKWCQEILNDPSYRQTTPYTRKTGADEDLSSFSSLMRKTLCTASTLRAMKFFYRPGQTPNSGELLALVSLGGEMCSHVDTLHGGINTVLVDEIGGGLAAAECPEPMMAVNFNVNLRRAIRTPGILLGRAWIEKPPQGRKHWIKVRLEQSGQVCIESENMYLTIKAQEKL